MRFLSRELPVSSAVFELGSGIVQLALVVLLIWCLYRIIARMLGLASYIEAEPPADLAGSPVRRKPVPKAGAGSVALAEPDDDE
jgi:hypothetical protein